MSNFYSVAKRPGGNTFERVEMIDRMYGSDGYGAVFPDGKSYQASNCTFLEDKMGKRVKTPIKNMEEYVLSLEERIKKLEDGVTRLKDKKADKITPFTNIAL